MMDVWKPNKRRVFVTVEEECQRKQVMAAGELKRPQIGYEFSCRNARGASPGTYDISSAHIDQML